MNETPPQQPYPPERSPDGHSAHDRETSEAPYGQPYGGEPGAPYPDPEERRPGYPTGGQPAPGQQQAYPTGGQPAYPGYPGPAPGDRPTGGQPPYQPGHPPPGYPTGGQPAPGQHQAYPTGGQPAYPNYPGQTLDDQPSSGQPPYQPGHPPPGYPTGGQPAPGQHQAYPTGGQPAPGQQSGYPTGGQPAPGQHQAYPTGGQPAYPNYPSGTHQAENAAPPAAPGQPYAPQRPATDPAAGGGPSGTGAPAPGPYGGEVPHGGHPTAPGAEPPPYGAPAAVSAPPRDGGPEVASSERKVAMLAHLGGVVFACAGWLPALVIYLTYRDRAEFVRHQASEALGFQLALLAGYLVTVLVWLGLGVFAPQLTAGASLFIAAVWLVAIVFGVVAAVATNRGTWYRYPVAIRLVK